MSFREFGAVVEGYKRREQQEWRRTRMGAYMVYAVNVKNPEKIERWMPLDGDPKPKSLNSFKRETKRLHDLSKKLWPV